jgi:glucan phosphorylase
MEGRKCLHNLATIAILEVFANRSYTEKSSLMEPLCAHLAWEQYLHLAEQWYHGEDSWTEVYCNDIAVSSCYSNDMRVSTLN